MAVRIITDSTADFSAQEARALGVSVVPLNVNFGPDEVYRDGVDLDPQEFYTAVQGLEQEPERGSRCTVCYRLRMRRAAQYAAEHGFDWFTTTLSISPHKDARRINEIGQQLEEEFRVKHLPSDFKKHNGYLRSLQLSEEYGLYRQDYCGCEFSARARGL